MKTLLIASSALLVASLAACAAPGANGRDGRDGIGEPGQAGEAGAPGPEGPPGPALPLTKARLSTRASAPQMIPGDGTGTASATCALPSDVIITGGCITSGGGLMLQASYPENANTPGIQSAWTCNAKNTFGGQNANLIAYAVCASP